MYLTTSTIYGVKTEHWDLNFIETCYIILMDTDLLCELVTLLLMLGVQMGEMPKLGWPIGLVKHAVWADFLVFPIPSVTFNFQNRSFIPAYPIILFIGMLGKFSDCAYVHRDTRQEACLFRQCSFCHIHRKCYRHIVSSVADLLPAWIS
jgi:hypothetical protein